MILGTITYTAESELSQALKVAVPELAALIAPFQAQELTPHDAEYQDILEKNRQKISAMPQQSDEPPSLGARLLQSFFSTRDQVYQIWNRQWKENLRLNESFFSESLPPTPYLWGDRMLKIRNTAGVLARILLLARTIEVLQPKTVAEIGSGDGFNLMFLASLFPEVEFTGIELAKEGVATAQAFQRQHDQLPEYMSHLFPGRTLDRQAFKRIRFKQGSAKKLADKTGTYDLVFTCVALEQMESFRETALAEVARVAKDWVAMLEPFRDFNADGPTREYIVKNRYFQGPIDELPRYGLEVVFQTDDLPQKLNLRAGLVVGRKVR